MIINDFDLGSLKTTKTPLVLTDGKGREYRPEGYVVPPEALAANVNRAHPLWGNLVSRVAAKNQSRVIVPELETFPIDASVVRDIKTAYIGESKTIYARLPGQADVRFMAPSANGLTDTELAREYIKACTEASGTTSREKKGYEEYLTWNASLYYEPGTVNGRHVGSFAYVDISSAYWTIHKTATIDMSFAPGRIVAAGRIPYYDVDEVTDYRGLRHAVPGMAKSGKVRMYSHGVVSEHDAMTRMTNPGIVGYTMYVMHCIAREVIDNFGAVMVLTDAYIVPEDRAGELIEFLRDRWGVDAQVKGQGEGAVYGMNMYQIGDYKSGHAPSSFTADKSVAYTTASGQSRSWEVDSSPKDTIMEVDSSWMARERSWLMKKGLAKTGLPDAPVKAPRKPVRALKPKKDMRLRNNIADVLDTPVEAFGEAFWAWLDGLHLDESNPRHMDAVATASGKSYDKVNPVGYFRMILENYL